MIDIIGRITVNRFERKNHIAKISSYKQTVLEETPSRFRGCGANCAALVGQCIAQRIGSRPGNSAEEQPNVMRNKSALYTFVCDMPSQWKFCSGYRFNEFLNRGLNRVIELPMMRSRWQNLASRLLPHGFMGLRVLTCHRNMALKAAGNASIYGNAKHPSRPPLSKEESVIIQLYVVTAPALTLTPNQSVACLKDENATA